MSCCSASVKPDRYLYRTNDKKKKDPLWTLYLPVGSRSYPLWGSIDKISVSVSLPDDADLFVYENAYDQSYGINHKCCTVAGKLQIERKPVHRYFDDRFDQSDADENRNDRIEYF